MDEGVRKFAKKQDIRDEGDDHPRNTRWWSTGSEQRGVGMQKRREMVEKEREKERKKSNGGRRGDQWWQRRRTEVRRRPDGLSLRLCKQTKMDCE